MIVAQTHDVTIALNDAFHEVVETMEGVELEGFEGPHKIGELAYAGVVGLAGPVFRGVLHLACTEGAARTLAGALLGGEDMLDGDPEMLHDTLGEVANMVAGSVKRRLDSSGAHIELSLPTVLEGESVFHGIGAKGHARLGWKVDGHSVVTSLIFAEDKAR